MIQRQYEVGYSATVGLRL